MIYQNRVMRGYEDFRSLLLKAFNSFSLVSNIDYSFLKEEGDYFSFITFQGLSISKEEFTSRKKLLDLLKTFKKVFYEVFNIETIEAKTHSSKEEYSLLFIDNERSFELVNLSLIKEEDNYLVNYQIINLLDNINTIINSRFNDINSFNYCDKQIAILVIQKNKEGVLSKVKRIKEELNTYRYQVIELNNNLNDEEKILLQEYPLIIEVGPGNIRKKQLTLITSINKIQIEENELVNKVNNIKNEINTNYYKSSLARVLTFQKKCLNQEELQVGNRFVVCDDINCLKGINDKLNGVKFFHSFTNIRFSKKCLVCQREGNNILFTTKK